MLTFSSASNNISHDIAFAYHTTWRNFTGFNHPITLNGCIFMSYKWGIKKPKNDSNASLNILLCSENGTVSVTVVEDIWLFLSDLRGLPLFLPNQMEHFDRYTIRHK